MEVAGAWSTGAWAHAEHPDKCKRTFSGGDEVAGASLRLPSDPRAADMRSNAEAIVAKQRNLVQAVLREAGKYYKSAVCWPAIERIKLFAVLDHGI